MVLLFAFIHDGGFIFACILMLVIFRFAFGLFRGRGIGMTIQFGDFCLYTLHFRNLHLLSYMQLTILTLHFMFYGLLYDICFCNMFMNNYGY